MKPYINEIVVGIPLLKHAAFLGFKFLLEPQSFMEPGLKIVTRFFIFQRCTKMRAYGVGVLRCDLNRASPAIPKKGNGYAGLVQNLL